jgi:hypothetical protein
LENQISETRNKGGWWGEEEEVRTSNIDNRIKAMPPRVENIIAAQEEYFSRF